MKQIFAALMLLSVGAAWAADNDRYLVKDNEYEFEVVLNKKEKAAKITMIEAKKRPPQFLDLVIYRSKKEPLIVSVKALDIKDEKLTYNGALDFHNESITGLAIQWNFDIGKKKIQGKKKN